MFCVITCSGLETAHIQGDVAVLIKSYVIGLQPFLKTKELKNNRTMRPTLKTMGAATQLQRLPTGHATYRLQRV